MTDKAKVSYQTAVDKAPDSLPALMALGLIYEQEKNFAKAQGFYERALKVNPNFIPAANNLAYIYADHGGNIDVALNLAQKAKERMPEDANISDTLGWIYYKKNVYSMAVSYLKESVEKNPNQSVPHYHLGMAYFKNGNKNLAKQELAEALRLNPNFDGAEEAKKTLAGL